MKAKSNSKSDGSAVIFVIVIASIYGALCAEGAICVSSVCGGRFDESLIVSLCYCNQSGASNQSQDLQALSDSLSALYTRGEYAYLWPQCDAKREILHYLDGFVGPIQWVISNALNDPTLEDTKYRHDVITLSWMLTEYTTKWKTHSLPPPHRRSLPQSLSPDKLAVFDEFIALRDECTDLIAGRRGPLFCREVQEWNLLMEQIGVILGYPGLAEGSLPMVDGEPAGWNMKVFLMRILQISAKFVIEQS